MRAAGNKMVPDPGYPRRSNPVALDYVCRCMMYHSASILRRATPLRLFALVCFCSGPLCTAAQNASFANSAQIADTVAFEEILKTAQSLSYQDLISRAKDGFEEWFSWPQSFEGELDVSVSMGSDTTHRIQRRTWFMGDPATWSRFEYTKRDSTTTEQFTSSTTQGDVEGIRFVFMVLPLHGFGPTFFKLTDFYNSGDQTWVQYPKGGGDTLVRLLCVFEKSGYRKFLRVNRDALGENDNFGYWRIALTTTGRLSFQRVSVGIIRAEEALIAALRAAPTYAADSIIAASTQSPVYAHAGWTWTLAPTPDGKLALVSAEKEDSFWPRTHAVVPR